MWQIVTGVDIKQLDTWINTLNEDDGQVKLSVLQKSINGNQQSPVDGLTVSDFKTVLKNLTKLKLVKADGSLILKYFMEQIRKQYGQRRSQEFDQLLIMKVLYMSMIIFCHTFN